MRLRGFALGVCAAGALAGCGGGHANRLVVSADRLPAVAGEIYRIDPGGRRTNLSRSPYDDTSPLVSPNGKEVAFVSDRGGRGAVYVVGIDGRRLHRVSPALPEPQLVGWSPGGKELAVEATIGSVSVLSVLALDGTQRALAREPSSCGISDAGWSPDGRLVAYVACGEARAVTPSGKVVFRERVSAQRTSLAWSGTNQLGILSGTRIRIVDERGRLLTAFDGNALAWSPAGDRVASMAGGVFEVRRGSRVILRKRLFPASTIRAIVSDFGSYDPQLVWVDDGRVAIGNVSTTENISGAGVSPYATVNAGVDVATGRIWHPTRRDWFAAACRCASQNGSLIAFTAKAGSGFALRISRTDGVGARSVARVPGCSDDGNFVAAVQSVQFAGRVLVYQSACYEPPANLYLVAPDGSGVHRLTRTRAQQIAPAWSPDGKRVAYVQAPATGLSCKGCPATLWVVDRDGTNAHALTHAESTWDASPSWSPDSKSIVFSRSSVDSPGELFVVPAAGGAPRDLHLAGDTPAWGPTRIAYLGERSLWTAAPDGSDRRKVATGDPSSPAWSYDGTLAYLDEAKRVVVVDGAAVRSLPLPFAEAASVTWSPDGHRLAVVARTARAGPFDVYSVDTNGGRTARITTNLNVLGAGWNG